MSYCDGSGEILSPESIAKRVQKEISKYFNETIANAIQVEVHTSVAKVLTGQNGQNLVKIESAYNKKILIKGSDVLKHEEIKIKEIDINTLVC